jgi:hypothetical protein
VLKYTNDTDRGAPFFVRRKERNRRSDHARGMGVLIIIALLIPFGLIVGRLVSLQPLNGDESDYVYAASKGLAASYLDQPSLSLNDFVIRGIRSGLHSGIWGKLSEDIRRTDDITLSRHFHAPLYFYWLNLVRRVSGPNEWGLRWASLIGLMLTAVVVFFGSMALTGQPNWVVPILATVFLLLSPTSIETSRWVAPHSLFAATAMATLFLVAMLIQTRDIRFLYGAAVALGLSFLTIEYAPLLAVVTVLTVAIHRRELFPEWSHSRLYAVFIRCAAIVAAIVAILWPGGIIKLGLIKNYGFFMYFAAIRSQAYGSDSFFQVWRTRVISSPIEFSILLGLTGAFIYLLFRRRGFSMLAPFGMYAVLVMLTTLRNRSESAYYISSLIPCLSVIAAFTISVLCWQQQSRLRVVAALVFAALVVNNYWFYYRRVASQPPDERLTAVVDVLREGGIHQERLLVPQALKPTIHYYFQRTELSGYTTDLSSYTEENSTEAVVGRLFGEKFDGVVYEGADYVGLRHLLDAVWSVRSIVRIETAKPERAVVYFQRISDNPAHAFAARLPSEPNARPPVK